MWQAARLDARQFAIWRKAFTRSAAYVIVGTDPKGGRVPRVTIEGPETVIVETDPADASRRLAALRLWHDSIAARWMATLYLPGRRFHWQTRMIHKTQGGTGRRLSWKPEAWEPRREPSRSLAAVPVAEFDVGIDVQNRLNLTILNRLTSERYAAFRQTALLNYEVEEDPVTGEPISPYNPGADQILTIPPPEPGSPATQLVSLPQTDTTQMLRAVEADMRAFAAVTLTPVYYLPGDLMNISADSVAALDAGHVAKVKQRMAVWGEGLEEVLQLMAEVAGLDRDLSNSEVVWARPENLNPAQVADYAAKLRAAGYPLPIVAERIGLPDTAAINLRHGVDTDTVYRRPFTTLYTALARGEPSSAAVASGQVRLAQIAEADLQQTHAHATQAAMRTPLCNRLIVSSIRTDLGDARCPVDSRDAYLPCTVSDKLGSSQSMALDGLGEFCGRWSEGLDVLTGGCGGHR